MNIQDVRIRCSALGLIMTDGTGDTKAKGELGKTCLSFLADYYRSKKYSREKEFTSKEIEKGIRQEEDAITLLSLEKKIVLKKNDKRLRNDFLTGEPDIFIGKSIETAEEGRDTKCSWSIWTMPTEADKLDKKYYFQDMGYMALTGAKKWTTDYCLVNAPADLIDAEKKKMWWAMGQPDDTSDRYMNARIEIEKNMIFDMAQFRRDEPLYILDCEDWCYDIPRSDRIISFPVMRDEDVIRQMYNRVEKCRNHLLTAYPNFFTNTPSLTLITPTADGFLAERG